MARLRFAWDMLWARLRSERLQCPYCRSCLHTRLQRKWLLIEARQCAYCGLIFRYPIDLPQAANDFYENHYQGQQATDLPSTEHLRELLATGFRGSIYDKSHRVALLKRFYAGGRALDFGCSWGYASAQLIAAGFDTIGFELSRSRAAFGREALGIHIESDILRLTEEFAGAFSLIYADHVVEHLCDLRSAIDTFSRLLAPNGRLVILVPNGGGQLARQQGVGWGPFLGESHTVALTATWFLANLPLHGFAIEAVGGSVEKIETIVDAEELVCVARRVYPQSEVTAPTVASGQLGQ